MIPPSLRRGNVPDLDPGTRAGAQRARCMNFFRKFTKSHARPPRGRDVPVPYRSSIQYYHGSTKFSTLWFAMDMVMDSGTFAKEVDGGRLEFQFFLIFCFANMRAVRPHGDTIYTKYTPRTLHIRILPKFSGIFQSLKVFKKFKKNQKCF